MTKSTRSLHGINSGGVRRKLICFYKAGASYISNANKDKTKKEEEKAHIGMTKSTSSLYGVTSRMITHKRLIKHLQEKNTDRTMVKLTQTRSAANRRTMRAKRVRRGGPIRRQRRDISHRTALYNHPVASVSPENGGRTKHSPFSERPSYRVDTQKGCGLQRVSLYIDLGRTK
ncbi:hypothetical protein AVEN_189530-1 [Araneus ventricosus]|uniref:Uncharacterized protein n=1 Tax=Araneus ventricosus TaxID=182803 RepID=A0A4Y2GNV6_ARAVE|nr:hypothetical protein AVEN_189530-1 [Araneus ventricosus]